MNWEDLKPYEQKLLLNKIIMALLQGQEITEDMVKIVPADLLTSLANAMKILKANGGMNAPMPKRLEMLSRILKSMNKGVDEKQAPIPQTPQENIDTRTTNAMGSLAMSNMLRG